MTLAALKNSTQTREPFVAFVNDKETKAIVAAVAKKIGWQSNRVVVAPFAKVVAVLTGSPTPEVLVIDVSAEEDPLSRVSKLAEVCDEGTRVVVIGGVNDVRLFRTLVEMGVSDYLVKPVAPQDLLHALTLPIKTPEPATKAARDAEMVFTIGVRGGVGVSTVAANIAWMMAHEQRKKTALVDLDLQFGTAALAFDLEPGRGMRDALEDPSRIDSLFIDRAFVRHSDNLRILAAEEGLDRPFNHNPDAARVLLEEVKGNFDTLVMDVPRAAAPALAPVMDGEATVIIVTDLSLAGMRDTMRFIRFFKEHAPAATVKILVNKAGETPQREMAQKDFEKGVEAKVDAVIPWDMKPAVQAEATGKAMAEVARKCKAVVALRTFAQSLVSSDEDVVKRGFFSRLLGKKE